MSPDIIYGSGGNYTEAPPPLFPRLRQYAGDDQYLYVMGELRRMIRDGSLRLTDIFRQPAVVRDTVGLAIHGQTLDPETRRHRAAQAWDEEGLEWSDVKAHRVKVRCIDGRADSVRFKRSVEQDKRPTQHPGSRGQATGTDPDDMRRAVRKFVDVVVDYKAKEAMLPLREAWICLGRNGKECRMAHSSRLEQRYWLFEEVPPDPPAEPEPEPEMDAPRRRK